MIIKKCITKHHFYYKEKIVKIKFIIRICKHI